MFAPNRTHVLVVEDNRDMREVLERSLVLWGYDAVGVQNGVEALAYLQDGGTPALIILDISMPLMDGVTFNQKLRDDPRWADIPVIVSTALPEHALPAAAAVFRKGSDDPRRLFDLVARHIQARTSTSPILERGPWMPTSDGG